MEGLFNLLVTLVVRNFADEERTALLLHLVQRVGDTSSPSASDRSVIKYRVLANIFNALPPASPLRLDVFDALLSLASANGDLDFLQAALESLPTWLAQWDVPAEKKHACLSSVASALQAPECGPEWVVKAYQFALLHLRYISAEASLSRDVRHSAAEKIIADVLRLPKLFEMEEMLHVPVTLELDGQPIFALLKIFVAGTHADLEQWVSQNKAVLERLALAYDALSRKMHLLDLATLCARSVSAEVSYADIAQVLNVSYDEVESWVIDVIRAGLVSGKLSQVKQSFRVYRSTHRTFEKPQWESLEQRLTQWQKSIQTLLSTIGSMYASTHPDANAQNRVPNGLTEPNASTDETPAATAPASAS